MDGKKVIVLGGGIAGLTAAQELSERGFAVEIFDLRDIPGGKSRSMPASRGDHPLPGEHGFRFFPAFYQHLPETMKRIPFGEGKSCFDNLVSATELELALYKAPPLKLPTEFPRNFRDFRLLISDWGNQAATFAPGEIQFFAERLWQVMTSCVERRTSELEAQSWWQYIGADQRSENYQRLMANGLSRSLVAAQPKLASARTIGQIQVRLIAGTFMPDMTTDRVLNGPTSDVFLNPWIAYLAKRGVPYHKNSKVTAIHLARGKVRGVTVCDPAHNAGRLVKGDWFVAALPVEMMAPLVDRDLLASAPELENIKKLAGNVRWMNGIQFFLKEKVPVVRGHVLHLDSPWAITSISEGQFWKLPLHHYGDGTVKDVLSVDISDWETPGRFIRQKAMRLGADRIAEEVWEELKADLNADGRVILRDEMLHSHFLDTDIVLPNPHRSINLEPLFINKPGSWQLRPTATTSIANLFLAADYVQTNTDLACMEAANEAARRAVNALLIEGEYAATECRIYPMDMPAPLAPLRWRDRLRYDQGKPWNGNLLPVGLGADIAGEIRTLAKEHVPPRAELRPKAERARAPGRSRRPGGATPPVSEAENAFHYRDYAGRRNSWSYIEWWYFNFVDRASGAAGMLTYAIFNPGNIAGVSTASFNAVIFSPQGKVVTAMDYWPGSQFAASYETPDVTLAGNRLSTIDGNTKSITAISKDRRIAFDLVYKQADERQLLEDSVRGYEAWEISSWLVDMPAAKVTGSFLLDGKRYALDGAAGYHDHDWGIWAIPFRTWSWAAFAAPDKQMGLDIGYHAAFQQSIAYFRLGNRRIVFPKFKVTQARFQTWRWRWQYPTAMTFSAIDPTENYKLEVAWAVRDNATLWKYPLVVFEQTAQFAGAFYQRRGKSWHQLATIDEIGFCEFTGTWV